MSHPSLEDRVVLVTGASRGLGREMALELAAAGARLVVTGSAMSDALRDVEAQIAPDRVLAMAADVADPAAARRAVAEAEARFGRVDVLINNAGRGMRLVSETFNTRPTRFWETDPQAWADIVSANLNGAFHMARAVTPGMIDRGFGKILNISTSAQTMIRRGYAPYGPSKAGLEAASRIWAQDLAGTGVDVNIYLPGGAADTDLLPPGPEKKGADGNLLSADIMRRGVLWLCSDLSNGTTGGRFIARYWGDTADETENSLAARDDGVLWPV
ncbi:Short-chain dehydrogenase/reductase SDR [Pseudooceanicola batsensis HTCC2597]|uniref:Short-chain dehydrogenase/reductase SDR n=1 Tax=Pseudooceanicola batsensis (strain ATCC BAA-863 / DSM 15984 / KCTC 12145 / HTCC2597) TaxID=252305 RepID=A3U0D5_PSEBH|nr:SDR family oxidoreductase [Pseudooceanicola batsensis]EAQ02226.1 Short-chain dehydrogenase/reductase SDR [Pseudooceanicola batsensis HTCC2597]